jgi:4-diphosphocytidyl-2-C-methyl-D-erythritol kinase
MPTVVRSFSKINLGLALGPSRPDGFHGLTTLYQTLDAHDMVSVDARPAASTRIAMTSNDRRVPSDSRNTAWKAVELALGARDMQAEVSIHINKRLPIQGGMGAGSANAVAALIGLEIELGSYGLAPLPAARRLEIAASVGSDVPLFLIGGAVLGVGRGEEVYPMPDLPVTHCVIALPEIGVSTPQAFHDWDLLDQAGIRDQGTGIGEQGTENSASEPGSTPGSVPGSTLTPPRPSDRLNELSRNLASALCEPHSSGVFTLGGGLAESFEYPESFQGSKNPLLALVRTGIENDFEEVVFPKYPSLGEIKRVLAASDIPEQKAIYASLSGSGSAVFGLYGTAEAAASAVARLQEQEVRSLLTKTLPREQYWASMLVK